MWDLLKSFRTILIFALLIIFIIGLAGLVYLAGTLSILPADAARMIETPLETALVPTLEVAAFGRFGQINPAIIEVLEYRPSNYGTGEMSVFDIQPVGIYIP